MGAKQEPTSLMYRQEKMAPFPGLADLFRVPGIFFLKQCGHQKKHKSAKKNTSSASIWIIMNPYYVVLGQYHIGFDIYWSCSLKNLFVPIYLESRYPIKKMR